MNKPDAAMEALDIREKGAGQNGQPAYFDRRVYCQLRVFTGCPDVAPLIEKLKALGLAGVLYRDANDPQGVGVLLIGEEKELFDDKVSRVMAGEPFASLTPRPRLTMLGRTYSTGHEQDLEDWMLERPKRYALDPDSPWAVWYPLRRKPEFEAMDPREKGKILMEHGLIGRSFGEAGLARDIRLACHGLNEEDNDFVLGLVGRALYPLSRLVQEMRKTQQTSKYIASLGPFFVGKALWQSPLGESR